MVTRATKVEFVKIWDFLKNHFIIKSSLETPLGAPLVLLNPLPPKKNKKTN
jgi:hypothetical protein